MYTTVINIKTSPQIKSEAKKVASDLGFTLSALVNAYLRQLIKTKTVIFSDSSEELNDYAVAMLNKSLKEVEDGDVISFSTGDDALKYLDNLILNDKRKD